MDLHYSTKYFSKDNQNPEKKPFKITKQAKGVNFVDTHKF